MRSGPHLTTQPVAETSDSSFALQPWLPPSEWVVAAVCLPLPSTHSSLRTVGRVQIHCTLSNYLSIVLLLHLRPHVGAVLGAVSVSINASQQHYGQCSSTWGLSHNGLEEIAYQSCRHGIYSYSSPRPWHPLLAGTTLGSLKMTSMYSAHPARCRCSTEWQW